MKATEAICPFPCLEVGQEDLQLRSLVKRQDGGGGGGVEFIDPGKVDLQQVPDYVNIFF